MKKLDETIQRGLLTELHCIEDITKMGFHCLKPISDASQYDIVVDVQGKFYRIQCKSSSWVKDTKVEHTAFELQTCRSTVNTTSGFTRYKYSADEIDYFYTWFEGQGYLISITEATGTTFRMRYEYPSNGQKSGIHIADNYKIEEVLKTLAT